MLINNLIEYNNILELKHYLLTILFLISLILIKKYFNGGVCHIKSDLTSKIILITGANRGIGFFTAKELAKMGGTIILACRDIQKAEEAKKSIIVETNNFKIDAMFLDVSDMSSVRVFASNFIAKYQKLDILINNAGLLTAERKCTKEGFEEMIATNHLGHFLLTNLLLNTLKASRPSRIIIVSSITHFYGRLNLEDINSEKNFFNHFAYGGSKLANILFANELASRLEGTGVKICSLHPGVIRSGFISNLTRRSFVLKVLLKIFHAFWWFFSKNERQGCQTTLYCALIKNEELENGKFYADCKVRGTRSIANDKEMMKKLWEISEKLVK